MIQLLIIAIVHTSPLVWGVDCFQVTYDHCFNGCPEGASENTVIKREIYTLSNNPETKFADWVAYTISPETVIGSTKQTRKWKSDPCLAPDDTLEPADYKKANKVLRTDRGHQAPLASFKGTDSWFQTNYLSNITPQKSELNQGPWRILEERVRDLVREGNTVYVITGPLYEKEMQGLPKADEPHQVPSGYWKIIFHEEETIQAAAFIFGQETARAALVLDYLVSIDDIEERTGLDFLGEVDLFESGVNREWATQHFGP